MTTLLKQPYRIELEYTNDEYTDLKPGDKGTVVAEPEPGRPHDTYWIHWDSGSRLSLIPGVDRFKRLDEPVPA